MDEKTYNNMMQKFKERVSDEEFDEKTKEFTERAKELEYDSPEDLRHFLARRWSAYLKAAEMSYLNKDKTNVRAVLVGIDRTDYGARYQYKQAIAAWERDKEDAVREGYTDTTGQPLFQTGNKRKGTPIIPEKIQDQYTAVGFFKEEGSTEYVPGRMRLRGKADDIIYWALYEFECGKFKEQEKKGFLQFSETKFTRYENPSVLEHEDVMELLKDTASEYTVTVGEAKQLARKISNNQDYDSFYFVVGDNSGLFLNDNEPTTNDPIALPPNDVLRMTGEFSLEEEGIPQLTVWLPKYNGGIPKRIVEDAIDIVAVGVPRLRDRDDGSQEVQMNALGLYVQKRFLQDAEPEPITPEPMSNKDAKERGGEDNDEQQYSAFANTGE